VNPEARAGWVETINGVPMALGAMSLSELVELKRECHTRTVESETDEFMVQYAIDQLQSGPEAAA